MKINYKNLLILAAAMTLPMGALAATKKSRNKMTYKKPAVEASNWSFGFYTEHYRGLSDTEAALDSYSMIKAKYKINDNHSLTFAEPFSMNWDDTSALTQEDITVQYDGTHGKIEGDLTVKSRIRQYLPVSKASNEIGRFQTRVYGSLNGVINPTWSFKAQTNPRFYGYSKDESGQLALKWINSIGLTAKLSDKSSITTTVGHIHYNRNTGLKSQPEVSHYLLEDPYDFDDSMTINVDASIELGRVTLGMWVEQETNLRSSESTSLFKDSQTTMAIYLAL